MALTLTPKRRRELERKHWFMHSNGTFVTRSVLERLHEQGATEVDIGKKEITYKGKVIPGIPLGRTFAIPEWLAENRFHVEDFDLYHSDYQDGPWEKWKEGVKNPRERLRDTEVAGVLRNIEKGK